MIVELLINIFVVLIKVVFGWIDIPNFPSEFFSLVDYLCELISSGLDFLSIFLDYNYLKIIIPLVIFVHNFDKVWNFIMFILRKIPVFKIE